MSPAEAESWLRCRSGGVGRGLASVVRAGRPRSRVGFIRDGVAANEVHRYSCLFGVYSWFVFKYDRLFLPRMIRTAGRGRR